MTDARKPRRRYREALRAIDEARRLYSPLRSDMTTDEYMALMREPVPDPGEGTARHD